MKKIDKKIIVLLLMITLYVSLFSMLFINDIINNYAMIINPISWIIMFLITLYVTKNDTGRFKGKFDKIQTVFIIILMYLIIYFISGLFFGYSRSPYSHNIIDVFKNIWAFLLIVVFQEYIRSALVNNCSKSKIFYVIVTILFVFIELNFYNFQNNFISGEESFKYISSVLFPTIVSSALCTYLSIMGGFKTSLAYRLPIIFATLILPIFPHLDWFITALLDTLVPFIIFLSINYLHTKKTTRDSKRKMRKDKPTKSIPLIICLLLFVGFVGGFFKYMPIAVMSNSMSKLINRGDIVVIEKLSKSDVKKLKLYDIIEYRLEDDVIIHRIIKIEKNKEGKIKYITKGDNNSSKDNKKVSEEQVMGLVKFRIPKAGYPIVLLNDYFKSTKPDVEMGKV